MSGPREMPSERLAEVRRDYGPTTARTAPRLEVWNLLDHIDALTARVKKAELDREDWRGSAQIWKDDHDAQKARADAAEKKLEALLEARRAEVEAGVRLAPT